MPGIKRVKVDSGFKFYYIDTDEPISVEQELRIKKLGIPPAWINVIINENPLINLQATGYDAKGRKQYIYSQVHRDKVSVEKFDRLIKFIEKLPILEDQMLSDQFLDVYDENRVISTMIGIVLAYNMRVGKEVYAKENDSYGITSLRKKHVTFKKDSVIFSFKGKSNQMLKYEITNPLYVYNVRELMKLPGDYVFQYKNGNRISHVTDRDLNGYIQKYMGGQFFIKDFRTYGANLNFLEELVSIKKLPKNKKETEQNIKQAVNSSAEKLKHTNSISKKSYVGNFFIDLYRSSPELFNVKYDDPRILLLQFLKKYR